MGTTFELTVQRATATGVWPVVAEYHRSGQLLPVRSEGELRLPAEPASASPRVYGEALGRALFSGPIRDAYVAARGDAPVRVWLCVEDAALRTWRWEWLCGPVDSTGWDFLSLDQRALYSLYLPSLTDRPYPPLGRRDLRALVVVANPADPGGRHGLTPFDALATVSRLAAVFNGRMSHDVLARVPEAIGSATLDGLVTQLTTGAGEGPYSLLHLVCHGRFDREADETWVYLERPAADATGAVLAEGVAATTLIERLRRVRQLPHFVFLSVCDSGAPEAEQRLGGLAQRLVRELGIPAVIGMTEPVTVATAHALSDAFYTRLLQPLPNDIGAVDCALVQAYAGLATRLDVHVPALYSRLGDQPLFTLAVDRELTGGEIRAGLARLDALLADRAPVLQPEIARHRQALAPWLAADPAALTADARQIREASLQAINEICQEAVDISFHALAQGEPVPAYDARQPFRGLSPFRAEDREFFFGRDALIDTLGRKLAEDTFLPVLGPSGSGKSSVVLAGLVPRLQHQNPDLQVAYLTPGTRPLDQLHAAQSTVGEGPVLYVVDQFEEVFTACRDEAQRRAFIDDVLALTTDHRVVLTMRADFWGECAPYQALRARMQARQELIAPMTTAELRSAMEQQAAKVGLRFEADLSQTILDEVAGEPGAMPLLQHALLELWKRRHGRWLRAAEYRALGGVKQAIAQTADRLYAELSTAEQDRMRDIVLRLTQLDEQGTPGDERRDTRRRVPLAELVPVGTDPGVTKRLVKQLADAVLVTTSRNPTTDHDEVEVAHEALIRHWSQLRRWLEDARSELHLWQGVGEAASEWELHGRGDEFLIHRGARLSSVEYLLANPVLQATALEREYVDACLHLRDSEQRKTEQDALARLEHLELQERSARERAVASAEREQAALVLARRTRVAAVIALGLAVLAVVGGSIAYFSRSNALRATAEAQSRYWSSEALRRFLPDPELGLKLAALAIRSAPPRSDTYGSALTTAIGLLAQVGGQPIDHGAGLIVAVSSDSGRFIAASGESGVTVRDSGSGTTIKLTDIPHAIGGVKSQSISWLQFVPKTERLIIADVRDRSDAPVCSVNLEAGLRSATLVCDTASAESVAIDPVGRWLAVGRRSGHVDFYIIATLDLRAGPQLSIKAHSLSVTTSGFSADGQWLATGSDDGMLRLWSLNDEPTLRQTNSVSLPEGRVSSVAFNLDRGVIIAGTGFEMDADGSGVGRNTSRLRAWSLDDHPFRQPVADVETSLLEITDIVAAESYVAILGHRGINPNDGRWKQLKEPQLFSLDAPEGFDFMERKRLGLRALPARPGSALSATIVGSKNQEWIAVSFADGTLELRAASSARGDAPLTVAGHRGAIWSISPTPEGFVTAGADGRLRLWKWNVDRSHIGASVPLPLSEWTAENFKFIDDNRLLIAYTSQPAALWTLADGRFTREPIELPQIDRIVDGKDAYLHLCRSAQSRCWSLPTNSGSDRSVASLPGVVVDSLPSGMVLVRSDEGIRICAEPKSADSCGLPVAIDSGRFAVFVANGSSVVAVGELRQASGNHTRRHRLFRMAREGNVLKVENVTETDSELMYLDSQWAVFGTSNTATGRPSGVVYRLTNATDVSPIQLPAGFGPLINLHVHGGRWLSNGVSRASQIQIFKTGGNVIKVLDLLATAIDKSGQELSFHGGTVRSVAFIGPRMIAGLEDGSVAVASLDRSASVVETHVHEGAVTAVATDDSGQWVATGDDRGTVRLWALDSTLRPLALMRLFRRQIDGMAFSRSGQWLALSGQGEAPRVINLSPEALAHLAEQFAGRAFTDGEVQEFRLQLPVRTGGIGHGADLSPRQGR